MEWNKFQKKAHYSGQLECINSWVRTIPLLINISKQIKPNKEKYHCKTLNVFWPFKNTEQGGKKNIDALQQTDSVKWSWHGFWQRVCNAAIARRVRFDFTQRRSKIIGMNWPLLWDSTAARRQTGLTWWRRWWWSLRRQRGRARALGTLKPQLTPWEQDFIGKIIPQDCTFVCFSTVCEMENMSWILFYSFKKTQIKMKMVWDTFTLSIVIGWRHPQKVDIYSQSTKLKADMCLFCYVVITNRTSKS